MLLVLRVLEIEFQSPVVLKLSFHSLALCRKKTSCELESMPRQFAAVTTT